MRTFNSRWLRPYQNLRGSAVEMVPKAIVTVNKLPFEQHTYQLFPGINGTPERTYISKYQYWIWLDLWFVKLRFGWTGRQRKAPRA